MSNFNTKFGARLPPVPSRAGCLGARFRLSNVGRRSSPISPMNDVPGIAYRYYDSLPLQLMVTRLKAARFTIVVFSRSHSFDVGFSGSVQA